MGLISNPRGSKSETNQDGLPVSTGAVAVPKRKWSNLMTLFVALVVIAEIAFLGRLDMAKNAAMVDTWADLFHRPHRETAVPVDDLRIELLGGDRNSESESCEEWLEREDAVIYSRNFTKQPVLVYGAEQFGSNGNQPDGIFGVANQAGTSSVMRSMESSQYYAENNVEIARRWFQWKSMVMERINFPDSWDWGFYSCELSLEDKADVGFKTVMTTSLSSDVPVGYFSWAEYDIMAPVQPKNESALAAAFISNCGARNFRMEALEALEKFIKIDSYGGCHRNHDGRVDKVETLKRYKFSLAFENSNEEDYVTEKFFQSLVAGSVPVVVGAPNIEDFAPSPGSILHIKELDDVESVAMTMRHLAENPEAYNRTLRWKYEGPTDSFKALVDMAAVHSSCRLCIHLATMIRENEEQRPGFKKRPCKCTRGLETVYHIYVRERGRFEMESIYLRSSNLTLDALKSAVALKFKSLNHVPVWKPERPESIRGDDVLKVYKIYPVGLTQRQALYAFRFHGDEDFRSHLESHPCAKFEVIFV